MGHEWSAGTQKNVFIDTDPRYHSSPGNCATERGARRQPCAEVYPGESPEAARQVHVASKFTHLLSTANYIRMKRTPITRNVLMKFIMATFKQASECRSGEGTRNVLLET